MDNVLVAAIVVEALDQLEMQYQSWLTLRLSTDNEKALAQMKLLAIQNAREALDISE